MMMHAADFCNGVRLALLGQAEGTATTSTGTTLLQQIHYGGTIGYTIILLSIIALGMTIVLLVRVRQARLVPPDLSNELTELIRRRDLQGAIGVCQRAENACFLTAVVGAGLSKYVRGSMGPWEYKKAMEDAGAEQVGRMYRATDALGWIASAGPLLGLLGTVVGIIQAFDVIAVAQSRPGEMAAAISKALVTTALGLLVAIPITGVFTYLRNRIEHFAAVAAAEIEVMTAPLDPTGAAASTKARPAMSAAPAPGQSKLTAPPGGPSPRVAPPAAAPPPVPATEVGR